MEDGSRRGLILLGEGGGAGENFLEEGRDAIIRGRGREERGEVVGCREGGDKW